MSGEGRRIAVRIDQDLRARIDQAIDKSGLEEATVIRLLVDSFCRFVEKYGFAPTSPFDIKNKDMAEFWDLARRLQEQEEKMALISEGTKKDTLPAPPANSGKSAPNYRLKAK